MNRSDAQTDRQAALRALAKSRFLRRLERDVAAGAGLMKALKLGPANALKCTVGPRGGPQAP